MMKMMIRRLLLLLTASCLTAALGAQTVKTVTVSNTASYTDHISLAEDSRDMDVMVKFVFNEENNTLTVSLLSYRSLFVFREATRYSAAVRCGKLHPELLPFLAEAEEGSRFTLSRGLKRAIPESNKRAHVFNRWIDYEGMQPAPMEYKMVNDYIEQTFDILQKRTHVSVTLGDVYLLEPRPNRADRYELLLGRNLDTRYQIEILRNPCFGLDEEIATAQTMLDEIRAAFAPFRKNYGSGEVASDEMLKIFEQTRALLLTQFPVRKNETECQDLKQLTDAYNQVVDSIATATCRIKPPEANPALDGGKSLDVKMLYAMARQLDNSVARWLVSNDEIERKDLVTQCRRITEEVDAILAHKRPETPEEQQAVRVFRQAEQYFKKVCSR